MKRIAILGSTGSIGTQALDVIERHPEEYRVTCLSCAERIEKLTEQIKRFKPEMLVVAKEEDALALSREYPHIEVLFGADGLVAAAEADYDILLNSLMGMRGLEPTYAAVNKGRKIAFANKETLVAGGRLITDAVKAHRGAMLLPVDSEHSAIFQCLEGEKGKKIRRILLTASGGPFRGFTRQQLEKVTPEQALKHPNWNMGAKITIDSATMMNKGLEVIEARWLFDVPAEDIEIVVHPQSVIHSAVEFEDTAVIAQMGLADMRVPISYAFAYPDRMNNADFKSLDLFEFGSLTFEKPNRNVFKCIDIAYDALEKGGSYTVVMNAANEVLVGMFLDKKIGFTDIQDRLALLVENHKPSYDLSLSDIMGIDKETREKTKELCLK